MDRLKGIPFRGVVPAALMPFADDLSIDRAAFRRHVAILAATKGVTAILVNGEAAQASALSLEERRTALAEALAETGGRVPILAGVGSGASDDVEAQAKDAERQDAKGLLVFPPARPQTAHGEGRGTGVGSQRPVGVRSNAMNSSTFRGPHGDRERETSPHPEPESANRTHGEAALERFRRIAGATSLPLVAFQQKVGVGPGYETEILLRIAAIPSVAAVKEGSGDPLLFERHLRALRAMPGNIAVWTTHSRWLLADLATGADGVVSGMGSVAASLHAQICEAVWKGDLPAARAASDRLFPLVELFYAPGINAHTRMKAALALKGIFPSARVRPPMRDFPESELAPLRAALERVGWI